MKEETRVSEPTEFVDSKKVGDAVVTAITAGVLWWNPEMAAPEDSLRAAMPDVDEHGRIRCELIAVHIRLGDASVLVDPGPDDPGTPWSAHFAEHWPGSTRTPGLDAGLAHAGITPEEITHVAITHAHFDHYVAVMREENGELVPRFPNARYLIQRAEWEENTGLGAETDFEERLEALADLGKIDLVDGDREIAPGIWMILAPGESRGHSVVRVTSKGESLWAVGDLFHHHCEIEHPDWVPSGRDAAAMRASREKVLNEAIPGRHTLVYTHAPFRPWGHVEKEANGRLKWVREQPI